MLQPLRFTPACGNGPGFFIPLHNAAMHAEISTSGATAMYLGAPPTIMLRLGNLAELEAIERPGTRPTFDDEDQITGSVACVVYVLKVRGLVVYEHHDRPRVVLWPWKD